MNISDYLMGQRDVNYWKVIDDYDFPVAQRDVNYWKVIDDYDFPVAKRITCKDGFSISVQATHGAYCSPRTNIGPWHEVECGFPSAEPELIMSYAEQPEKPMDTVYAYVPIDLVEQLIALHGGSEQLEAV